MRTYEIKGFWGFILFTLVSLSLLTVIIVVPVGATWITWNAIVGDVCHGPIIAFWQAALLTASMAIAFKIIFQPQISFQIKKVKSVDPTDKKLQKFKGQDSSKD